MGWLFPFCVGFGSALLLWFLWRALQLYLDLKITRAETARAAELAEDDETHNRAWESISACRKRLRFRKEVNPRWFAPLIEEIPKMVREIAAIYHPDEPEPLAAPKLSEFSRAVELCAADISNFLQERRAGRLVDLSAGRAWRTWERTRDFAKNPKVSKAHRVSSAVYKKVRPVVQVLRYKSPLTWASIAARNAAARTLQPAVVNIVGHRTIQLYSGQLQRAANLPAPPLPEPELDADDGPEED